MLLSNSQSDSATISRGDLVSTWMLAVGMSFVIVAATVAHWFISDTEAAWLLSGPNKNNSSAITENPNTIAFALVGVTFLVLTLVSHLPAAMAFGKKKRSAASQVSPVGLLILPMTIRFAGTFAILGGLWITGTIPLGEAGFDVLFWYVTLTAIEVVGIVWASKTVRSDEHLAATGLGRSGGHESVVGSRG